MRLAEDNRKPLFSCAPILNFVPFYPICQSNKRPFLNFLGGAFLFSGRGRKEAPPWKAILWERLSPNLTAISGLRAIFLTTARARAFTRATGSAVPSTILSPLSWENSKHKRSILTGPNYPHEADRRGAANP